MPKQIIALTDTIENNSRLIDSLATVVMGFDYGCYDDNTIPDCMFIIGKLAREAREASEEPHKQSNRKPEIVEG